MAVDLISPTKQVEDVGEDPYIRLIREIWIKYADPKYIDLIDTDFVATGPEALRDPELDITIPEVTVIRPLEQ